MSEVGATKASVTDLVRNFADACRALVPSLDRARVPWTDAQHYDNWERVAEALFESLVLEPCRFQAQENDQVKQLTLTPYGSAPSGDAAFVELKAIAGVECRFVQLLSRQRPFDHCEGALGNQKVVVPIDDADLSFVMVDADGSRHEIREVNLTL